MNNHDTYRHNARDTYVGRSGPVSTAEDCAAFHVGRSLRDRQRVSERLAHVPAERRGFTLVEIMVTVVIIGILAGMVMTGLMVARQSARVAATKVTITKLNNVIMKIWDSYKTRRVPIDTTGNDSQERRDGEAVGPPRFNAHGNARTLD